MKTIAVIGLGYIGLPTAVAFATRGINVIGVDVNSRTVEMVSRGEAPFAEPDLAVALQGAVSLGRLRAVTEPEQADVFVIAVPTPFTSDHQPDLRHVRAASASIAPYLADGNLVVLESTSPPGTTADLCSWLSELRPDLTFPHLAGETAQIKVAYCPERVLPGRIMIEIVANDRIVGGVTPVCADAAASLYRIICRGECFFTDSLTAEIVKLAENAFRDVNIAFANELSLICEHLDADPFKVIRLANKHPRVSILRPGPGVGGHCIAVDPWFLVHASPERSSLIRAARSVNDAKPAYVVSKVVEAVARFKRPVVACLGLSFKADVDDLRQSPALEIVRRLAGQEIAKLLVAEPNISCLPASLAGVSGVELSETDVAVEQADIVLGLVAHDAFKRIRTTAIQGKIVVDTCGIWC